MILYRQEGTRQVPILVRKGGAAMISLSEAIAAAECNGIDMRLFELAYEAGDFGFGYISQTGGGAIIRGETGRIMLTLMDPGLRSGRDAVETIAHELNHVRSILRGEDVLEEGVAEISAQAVRRYFR